MRNLIKLTAVCGDDDLLAVVNQLQGEEEKDLVLSILLALRDGNLEGAMALLDKFDQRASAASERPDALESAVHAEINSDVLVNLRELSDIEIEHLFSRATFKEWLTFLHPDQKRLVGFPSLTDRQ